VHVLNTTAGWLRVAVAKPFIAAINSSNNLQIWPGN